MIKINSLILVFIAFVGAYSSSASAFCFYPGVPSNGAEVAEYYDVRTDRFFLSWQEQATDFASCPPVGLLSQPPPADSSFRGLAWLTLSSIDGCSLPDNLCASAKPLCRFRSDANREPASMFVTISEGECELLKRPGSGWTYLPDHASNLIIDHHAVPPVAPRLAAIQHDPATGQCPGGTIPVHRFYNNRWQEGLGNHRFVANEAAKTQMRSRASWFEEGVAFCVLREFELPIETQSQAFAVYAAPPCLIRGGPYSTCVVGENMASFNPFRQISPTTAGYFDRTGAITAYVSSYRYATDGEASAHSFVQLRDLYTETLGGGFFVTSADRTSGSVSGLAARSLVPLRFYSKELGQPFFARYDVEIDLGLSMQPFVKRIRTTGEDSQAFVFSEIVFVDDTSRKKLELNLFAIGTPSIGDFVGRDGNENVLAVFALGPAMTYGRSVGLPMQRLPRTFDSPSPYGHGGDFGYRINRTEFERLLQRARIAQPLLSADASDYRIESFAFKGQVAGTGEIGYNLQKHELSLVRP